MAWRGVYPKWVTILLNNFKGVINHFGDISESFQNERGGSQGDPIESYIFILFIDILAYRLRTDDRVQGLGPFAAGDDEHGEGYSALHNLHHRLEVLIYMKMI